MPMTTVYIGRCNERDYVFALDRETAQKLVEEHFAFGDPTMSEYAISNKWAAGAHEKGWKIVSKEADVQRIKVEIKGGEEETSHVAWTCPVCKEVFSDAWASNDCLPVLLSCGCSEESKFLLGLDR